MYTSHCHAPLPGGAVGGLGHLCLHGCASGKELLAKRLLGQHQRAEVTEVLRAGLRAPDEPAGHCGWPRGAVVHRKAPPRLLCPCAQEAGLKGAVSRVKREVGQGMKATSDLS